MGRPDIVLMIWACTHEVLSQPICMNCDIGLFRPNSWRPKSEQRITNWALDISQIEPLFGGERRSRQYCPELHFQHPNTNMCPDDVGRNPKLSWPNFSFCGKFRSLMTSTTRSTTAERSGALPCKSSLLLSHVRNVDCLPITVLVWRSGFPCRIVDAPSEPAVCSPTFLHINTSGTSGRSDFGRPVASPRCSGGPFFVAMTWISLIKIRAINILVRLASILA